MADLFDIWRERVERALTPEEKEKKKATFCFKKDDEFHDIAGRAGPDLMRRSGLAADVTVALRSHSFEPTSASSANRESVLFNEALFTKKHRMESKSKIKISRRELFLPPQKEIDAVDRYCDDLQKAALADVVKRSREKHEKQVGILKDRITKLTIPGSSGQNWTDDDFHALLLWIRDEAPIIIHIPFESDERLEKLTVDTHFRNQFETRISRGTLDFSEGGSRHGWESRIFTKHYDKAEPFQRPKYGCLNIVNDPIGISCATCYGSSYIILKGCRLRTSFADKDTSCSDVEIASCEYHAHVLSRYTDQELNRVLEVATRRRLWHDSDIIINYKEVQIHGELRLNENIDLVVIDASFKSDEVFLSKVATFCRKNNCNYVLMPARGKKKEFDGNIWSMAGGVEPEGFLATDPKLPSFLASDDFSGKSEGKVSVRWNVGEKVFVKIGATCRPGIISTVSSACSYTVTVEDSKKIFTSDQISDSRFDAGEEGVYVLCEGDLVHAVRSRTTIGPGEILRVSKDSCLVSFEDSPKKAVRISNNKIFKTGAPLRVYKHDKRWEEGNRVSVHLQHQQACEVGTVTNVDAVEGNQYCITLDSGVCIKSYSHRMSDEPDIKVSGSSDTPKVSDLLCEGLVVHARRAHVGIYEGVLMKPTIAGSTHTASVKIFDSESSSGYKVINVPHEEITIVGNCHFPVEGVIRTYGVEPTVSVYGVPYVKEGSDTGDHLTPWMDFDMFTEIPASSYDHVPVCGGVTPFGVLHEGILAPNFDDITIPTELPTKDPEATSFCHWMEADFLFEDHVEPDPFSLFNDDTSGVNFPMGSSSSIGKCGTASFALFDDDVTDIRYRKSSSYEEPAPAPLPRLASRTSDEMSWMDTDRLFGEEKTSPKTTKPASLGRETSMADSELSWMAADRLFGDSHDHTTSTPSKPVTYTIAPLQEPPIVSLPHGFDDVVCDVSEPFSPPDRFEGPPPSTTYATNAYTSSLMTATDLLKNDSAIVPVEMHLSEQYAALTRLLELAEAQRDKVHKSLCEQVKLAVKHQARCVEG